MKINCGAIISLLLTMCIFSIWTVSCRPHTDSMPPRAIVEDRTEAETYETLSPKKLQQVQQCDADMDRMELCMRCAKVTKSFIVYPMCCGDEDGVTQWCQDYVYFGLGY